MFTHNHARSLYILQIYSDNYSSQINPLQPSRGYRRSLYTHDSRLLEKLRRLAEKYPDQIVKKDRQTFLVPKRCVSVREAYSAERRKAASERAKAAGYRPPKK